MAKPDPLTVTVVDHVALATPGLRLNPLHPLYGPIVQRRLARGLWAAFKEWKRRVQVTVTP